jgi:hypothetical protein
MPGNEMASAPVVVISGGIDEPVAAHTLAAAELTYFARD